MELRCTPGILALVIHDTAPCMPNVGRVVQVRGPLRINPELNLPCWLIKPVRADLYFVEHEHRLLHMRVYWKSLVEHPDAWLLPIDPLRPELEAQTFVGHQVKSASHVCWDEALASLLRRYPTIDTSNV
jgi:hypothetical protein